MFAPPFLRRLAAVAAGTGAASAAVYSLYLDTEGKRRVRCQAKSVGRAARAGTLCATIGAEYKVHQLRARWHGWQPASEEYLREIKPVHERNAERIVYICQNYGGMYTKFGQYLSSMNYLLPAEYTKALAVLQSHSASRPWEDIQEQIELELGAPISSKFRSFSQTCIAAASIAQVHQAVTLDGAEVAVKVQYPGLEYEVSGDWWLLRTTVAAIGYLFPEFEYSWMVPEFENNMKLELDFVLEARNAEMLAKALSYRPDAYVPTIRHDLSSKRVLTMQYVHGVKVTDRAALAELGLVPLDVANVVASVFGDMIFCCGIVHCDPHAGNLLVRRSSDGKPQLVILDHGMYRQLAPGFRESYCRIWQALITQDKPLLEQAANELGVGRFIDVLPKLFTFSSSSSTAPSGPEAQSPAGAASTKSSDADKDLPVSARPEHRPPVANKFKADDMNEFARQLPKDLFFVLRCTNLLRSVSLELGGTSIQRFRIYAACAIKGLQTSTDGSIQLVQASTGTFGQVPRVEVDVSFSGKARQALSLTNMKLRVWLLDVVFGWLFWWRALPASSSTTAAVAVGTPVAASASTATTPTTPKR